MPEVKTRKTKLLNGHQVEPQAEHQYKTYKRNKLNLFSTEITCRNKNMFMSSISLFLRN